MLQPSELAIVGNDIVDLRDAEAVGKSQDTRFAKRVLCSSEYRMFEQHPSDTTLWLLWAAKEAAYKVVHKRSGTSPMARSLRVVGIGFGRKRAGAARVECPDQDVQIRWTRTREYVHCVAWGATEGHQDPSPSVSSAIDRTDAAYLRQASPTRGESVTAPHIASTAARVLARELFRAAASSAVPVGPIGIVRRPAERGLGPPRFCLDDRPLAGWDLSLSHHGRYVAAAVAHRARPDLMRVDSR